MISTDIDICNMALDHLAVKTITSLDEGTKQASKCALWYDTTRRSLLLNLNASFSIDRAVLAEVKNFTPIYGFGKAFALPKKCLQVLNLGEPLDDNLYQIEGKYFYCDESIKTVAVRYIKDVSDVTLFDDEFSQLLALALAEQICVSLTEDYEKRNFIRVLKKEKYIECSTKYGRDNKVTVINKPRYRNSRFNAEDYSSNYHLR